MKVNERPKLSELVSIITTNAQCFYKIGCALKQIKDNQLYREISDTFEKFCKNHLGMSRTYAYRQIAAITVIDNLSPIGNIPINEFQIRPLTKLDLNQQQIAWKYANDIAESESRKVTSQDVIEGVLMVTGKKGSTKKNSEVENIDVTSKEFKKAYEIFFDAIKNAMNSDWEKTSKEVIIVRLKMLIKFIKTH